MATVPNRNRVHLSTLCLAFVVASAFYGVNMQPEETRFRDQRLTVWTYGWPCTVIRDYAFDGGLRGRTVYAESVMANGAIALVVIALLGWMLESRNWKREADRAEKLGAIPPAEAPPRRDETPGE
ncbi:MAG: hypothetical protein L6R28_19650 [Planctomycetes bacterium]|nr:hypothetical protein [Planctomycetota bacterium]